MAQNFDIDKRLDQIAIQQAMDVLDGKQDSIRMDMKITNVDRTFGATLSNEISRRYKEVGLRDDSIYITLNGHAGQSFGAFLGKLDTFICQTAKSISHILNTFLASGVTLELCGDANDYVGKGLSGGKIIIYPPKTCGFKTDDSIIVS